MKTVTLYSCNPYDRAAEGVKVKQRERRAQIAMREEGSSQFTTKCSWNICAMPQRWYRHSTNSSRWRKSGESPCSHASRVHRSHVFLLHVFCFVCGDRRKSQIRPSEVNLRRRNLSSGADILSRGDTVPPKFLRTAVLRPVHHVSALETHRNADKLYRDSRKCFQTEGPSEWPASVVNQQDSFTQRRSERSTLTERETRGV